MITGDLLTPLHLSVFSKQIEAVNMLLNHPDIDVDIVPDVISGSALHLAANIGSLQLCFMLLINNASATIVDSKRRTADQVTHYEDVCKLIKLYQPKKSKKADLVLEINDDEGQQTEVKSEQQVVPNEFMNDLNENDPFFVVHKHLYKIERFWKKSLTHIYESF